MITAKPDCCEEAAILPAGFVDAYIPCNKPATQVVGWPYRSEKNLRMCEACATHNVKNRGATLISAYVPEEAKQL